jgi:hypothetical protein
MFCTSCGSSAADAARFCAKCGTALQGDPNATTLTDGPVEDGNLETIAPGQTLKPPSPTPHAARPASSPTPSPRASPSGSNPLLSSSDAIGGGRFAPGVIVADRYRVVALLGRGGMGEVYRAEDLKLSQVVAIKFLPETLSRDAAALARFHSEVRIARQVSHPNVCRVFDIGDANGIPFLTMEYVDGEDLSSLVRRIGRLPQDKATEVSRQICAGLAAAHERGVVHRDLKPSNVMLDGAGKARITDFGLAGIAANIQGAEVRAGTPAYMAPEQLAGKEVTFKSDIYSLGLVMYEMLTGKRAFVANSMAELMKAREEGTVTNPSTLVKDLDPLIERVILRCLEKEPSKRPSSALQVAAALPGGDPLAAALAAGETPSPEMVAASGEKEGIRPVLGLWCFLSIIVLVLVCAFVSIRESGLEHVALPYSPEVMAHKARETITSLGYTAEPKDMVGRYSYEDDFLEYLNKKEKPGASAWSRILGERPPLLSYWFRQSPELLVAAHHNRGSLTPGMVEFDDPPPTFSGMVRLRLDSAGRLLYFEAIPAEKEEQASNGVAPDWQPLFAAADLKVADFRPATPAWAPLASADSRAAWDGTWPGTSRALHLEAAAWHGKPVFFLLASAWTVPSRMAPEQDNSQRALQIFGVTFTLALVFGGLWLAYRNYVRKRGDRRGAWRAAGSVFVLELLLFLFLANLHLATSSLGLLAMAVSTGMLISGIFWAVYLALEPYVRSKWPQTIVSWSRLLAGNVRDPLVGRDALFGVLLGMVWVFVIFLGKFFNVQAGEQPFFASSDFLQGLRFSTGVWLAKVMSGILGVMEFFFILVLLRVLVRNRWVAAALFVIFFSLPSVFVSSHRFIDVPVSLIVYGIAALAVVRFGLVALATAVFTANLLLNVPYTVNGARWYAADAGYMVLSVVVLAAWGYYTSLAGAKLLKEDLFD